MIPIRFGAPTPTLYGVFHAAEGRPANPRAVLMCNPFGQEAVRIHRFFRVLAERLARLGIASLRFDHFATGESLGEDTEADLERWTRDILNAHELLRQRAQSRVITWLAPRLAAPLAARASAQVEPVVRQLILWEPVVQGTTYLQALRAAHEQTLASLPDRGLNSPFEQEIIGFGVTPRLLHQFEAIGPDSFRLTRAQRVTVLESQGTGPTSPLVKQLTSLGLPTVHEEMEIAFDWNSEEALNTALVPASALQRLLHLVVEDGHA